MVPEKKPTEFWSNQQTGSIISFQNVHKLIYLKKITRNTRDQVGVMNNHTKFLT